jgi:hypothetical protein
LTEPGHLLEIRVGWTRRDEEGNVRIGALRLGLTHGERECRRGRVFGAASSSATVARRLRRALSFRQFVFS